MNNNLNGEPQTYSAFGSNTTVHKTTLQTPLSHVVLLLIKKISENPCSNGGSTSFLCFDVSTWRWVVRLETMRERWRRHCVTVSPVKSPGGWCLFYPLWTMIKSMTHTYISHHFSLFVLITTNPLTTGISGFQGISGDQTVTQWLPPFVLIVPSVIPRVKP